MDDDNGFGCLVVVFRNFVALSLIAKITAVEFIVCNAYRLSVLLKQRNKREYSRHCASPRLPKLRNIRPKLHFLSMHLTPKRACFVLNI